MKVPENGEPGQIVRTSVLPWCARCAIWELGGLESYDIRERKVERYMYIYIYVPIIMYLSIRTDVSM